jgi:hypothetical protein
MLILPHGVNVSRGSAFETGHALRESLGQKTHVSSAVLLASSTGRRVIGRTSGRIARSTLLDRAILTAMIRKALALALALGCSRGTPPLGSAPDAAPAPAPSVSAPPAASASAAADPGGGLLGAWAKEDAMPIGALFDSSQYLVGALYRRIGKKHDRSGIASLTDVERNIFLSYTIDAEERFGGFGQYFDGDSGDRAAPTLAALKAIGAAPFAEKLDAAMALFPNKKPAPELAARRKQIAAIGDRAKWDALDKDWKKLPDLGKTHIEPYARVHKSDLEASNPR